MTSPPNTSHEINATTRAYLEMRQQAISWLVDNGYPALPVAPYQDPYRHHKKSTGDRQKGPHCPLTENLTPVPLFTGKNPSYLDSHGKPHLVNHAVYQNRCPTEQELQRWFRKPETGIGTLGGWNNTWWIDLDSKRFSTQAECDRQFTQLLEAFKPLQNSFLERTQSGGYRLAVRFKVPPQFTNFALSTEGDHVGEVLGTGKFAVLAPTIGSSGSYQNLNRQIPVEIPNLEGIGIYPVQKQQQQSNSKLTSISSTHPVPAIPGAIPLEDLGNQTSRDVLRGEITTNDRSDAIATAIQEWYGWENWARQNGVSFSGTTEELTHLAGDRLGIDSDRIKRILATVDRNNCQPACLFKGDETSAWKKIRRLNQAVFEANCPSFIREMLVVGEAAGTLRVAKQAEAPQQNQWKCLDSHNHELGYWTEAGEFKSAQAIPKHLKGSNFKLIPVQADKKAPGNQDNPNPKEKVKVLRFNPVADFDFQVKRVLESTEGGGLVLLVERLSAGQLTVSEAIVPSISTTKVTDFVNCLKKEIGTNICCLFKPEDLQRLLHVRTETYRCKGGKTYGLIDRIGQQHDGVWVFESIQFSTDGNVTTEESSGWVFNPSLGEIEKIPSPVIHPPNPKALRILGDACKAFFSPETLPLCWFTCGYVAAVTQWQRIFEHEQFFPQLALFSDPGGGKTTAAKVAWSLCGLTIEPISAFSESLSFELAKSFGGIPILFDDPIRKGREQEDREKIENFLWKLFNGASRKVRGNEQTPHTAAVVTSNLALGEGHQAVESRLIKLYFPATSFKADKYAELREAMKQASGGFYNLIQLGYPRDEILALEKTILKRLQSSHARISFNLAIATHYTQKFCDLAGIEFDAPQYCLDYLCPSADGLETDKNSLDDFLGKLQTLRSEDQIGDWNVVVSVKGGKNFLAVYMPGVWSEFSRRFTVNYSRQLIEKLVQENGGINQQNIKFVESKLTWLSYLREQANFEISSEDRHKPRPPQRKSQRKALLIPYHLVAPFWDCLEEPSCEVATASDTSQSYLQQVTPETSSRQPSQTEATNATQATTDKQGKVDEAEHAIAHYTLTFQQIWGGLQPDETINHHLLQVVEEMRPLPQHIKKTVWRQLKRQHPALTNRVKSLLQQESTLKQN